MLDTASLWLIGPALFASQLLALWLGAWAGRRARGSSASGKGAADGSYVLSGVFGLSALLMAFSLSLAIGRYETRRHLVVAEATALTSMGDRIALLPPERRPLLERDLAAYAQARAETGKIADDAGWEAESAKSEALLDKFTADIYAAIDAGPADTRLPVLVAGIDALGQAAINRHAERAEKLPWQVIALLGLYCIAGAAALGYTLAAVGARHLIGPELFLALLTTVFLTVVDLDRPRNGAILVPQEELLHAAAKLGR